MQIEQINFKTRAVPMSVSEDFILQSQAFDKYTKEGLSREESVLACLRDLGGDTSDVFMTTGLVRLEQPLNTCFVGNVYNLFTTEEFEHKHIWENISLLKPSEPPKGVETFCIEDLGDDYYSSEESDIDVPDIQVKKDARGHYKKRVKNE